MTGIASGAYRFVSVKRRTRLANGPALDYIAKERAYDPEAPIAEILRSAGDTDARDRYHAYLLREFCNGGPRGDESVYIVSVADHDICKIGVSYFPTKRLTELQNATWCTLNLVAVLHPSAWSPLKFEEAALKLAAEEGRAIRGEWIRATPEEAIAIAIRAADKANKPVYGSDAWFDNLTSRVHAMKAAQVAQHAAWKAQTAQMLADEMERRRAA